MPADAPIVIIDGSLVIEADDEVAFDSTRQLEKSAAKRYKYKLKREKDDKHIRRVVIEREGKVIYDDVFKDKTCRIEIYWDEK
jgi:hypothetical protein